jgi:hypothetical protein
MDSIKFIWHVIHVILKHNLIICIKYIVTLKKGQKS